MPLLTVHEMQQRIAKMKYKGWDMWVREGFKEGPHFEARVTVEDSTAPGKTVDLEVHSPIPPQVSMESFNLWVSWRITRVEIHESMEFLQVDGKPLYDPHKDDKDKWDFTRDDCS